MRSPVIQEVTRRNPALAAAGCAARPGAARPGGVRLLALFVPALVLWGALGQTAHAAHPHYERLFQEGRFALEQGDPTQAVEALRLACFGLLEDPPILADCLVRLALAQSATGDVQGFLDTFRRVVEVEERFRGYSGAELGGEVRSEFEDSVVEHVPESMLRGGGIFADLAGAETGEAGSAETSPPVAEAPAPPAGSGGGKHAAEEVEAGLSQEDRARLDRARELMATARSRSDLDQPFRLAREVAEANPGSREAQHLAAVIAYRAARWEDAVRYFRRGGDPGEDQPEVLFYMAVALFESGDVEAAADALRRSLPRLESTPFVRSYQSKILEGQSTSSPPTPELQGSDRPAPSGRAQKGVER